MISSLKFCVIISQSESSIQHFETFFAFFRSLIYYNNQWQDLWEDQNILSKKIEEQKCSLHWRLLVNVQSLNFKLRHHHPSRASKSVDFWAVICWTPCALSVAFYVYLKHVEGWQL